MENLQGSRLADGTDHFTTLSVDDAANNMSFNVLNELAERSGEENFEDDIIVSAELVGTLKHIMRRLTKAQKQIKMLKERLRAQARNTSPESQGETIDTESGDKQTLTLLQEYINLELFLWGQLAKILHDEYKRCTDVYASTMSLQDRAPFESLIKTVCNNAPFCEYMGEMINFNVERDDLLSRSEGRSIQSEPILYKSVVRTQSIATYTAFLLVEGSRGNFLDSTPIQDLCKVIIGEKKRQKRLIALSLVFSRLEEDDQAVGEALSQQLPRVLLQRLRHLVHRIFGYPENNGISPSQRWSRSPFRHYSAVIRSELNSPTLSRKTSPEVAAGSSVGVPCVKEAQQVLPQSKQMSLSSHSQFAGSEQASSSPMFDRSTIPIKEVEHESTLAEFNQGGGDDLISRPHKKRKFETGEESPRFRKLPDFWQPRRGDRVGRGPMWCFNDQGKKCDFGEVVEVTTAEEVVVRWIRSVDCPPHESEGDRFFRYKYKGPNDQVVPWDHFLNIQTLMPENIDFKMEEFMLCCAVVGALCHQRETVLPALQFQTVESMFYVLSRVDLDAATAAVETEEKKTLGFVLSEDNVEMNADERELLEVRLNWSAELQTTKSHYRKMRELVGRVGWVLNSLFTHKKLALIFLELGGLKQIIKLTDGRLDPVTMYGCCIVLSQLARAAVFENLLRNHGEYFEPILNFILHQWKVASSHDVQGSAGGFLFLALSFPYVVTFFDAHQGPQATLGLIERLLQSSEEQFDVICPGVTLAALKCAYVYLISHLMLATRVIFRKHRFLSVLVTDSAPERSLPRDPATVESVLGYLSAPSATIPDISTETIQSLLTRDRLAAFRFFADNNFHQILLRCAQFYFTQGRWDLLAASLNVLCVLVVVPFFRPLVADAQYPESGVAHLIMIVSELTSAFQNGNASRESHLIPCVATSLQILLNLTRLPADKNDDVCVATFNRVCGMIRANDGVRTLLEVLKVRKDPAMSVKLQLFPVVARALQLMVTLRRYADTRLLFDALGVGSVARELMIQYGDIQKEYLTMMGPRYVASEVHATGRFMENIKCFLFDETNRTTPSVSVDPVELEQRQAVIARSHISYSRESLLELICRHLETEGLLNAASALRRDAPLSCDIAMAQHSANASPDMALSPIGAPTLDGIVRSYLRQQHEKCTNPITTLPQFDLRKGHVYYPLDAPVDQTRNAFNRRLVQKMGLDFSLRTRTNENHFTYRNPGYLFDITGSGDELQGDSVAFCDGGETLVVGTSEGGIALFDTFPDDSTDDKLSEQHLAFDNGSVVGIYVSDDSALLGLVNAEHKVAVMGRNELPAVKYQVEDSRAAMFSCCNTYLLATCDEEHTCRLYDLRAQCEVRHFSDPSWVGENVDNVATFDQFSQLVLSDAVLWDVRCGDRPICRFDRFTNSFCNIFHPFNPLVMIDEKVWDLRTLSILQTVPSFRNSSSFYTSPFRRVIYSFREASALSHTATPVLSVVDSYTFETVFSTEVRPAFRAFAIEPSDRYCAAILDGDAAAVVRVFSTSSGPLPGQQAFSLPQNDRSNDSGAGLAESDDDDEVGNNGSWSGGYDEDDDDGEDDSDSYEWASASDSPEYYSNTETTSDSDSAEVDGGGDGSDTWTMGEEETTESQDEAASRNGENSDDEASLEST
ncbi:uncharacterized protein TEOVI_000382600 [Trypanosoma equiperdum]|uniref:Uncharacterized protein n=1 Tax=Trypanosoma equiperdum TaxID=5694 RepID=A0A1G4IIU4_TRYEQ|nr:hypothetical protein, conserved [Trypanosoma equiperdum]